jgi:peptidoglycan/LPS O-acetylase OafA/YrhL
VAADGQSSSNGRTAGHLPFRSDIEGLRAVAILLVVAFHAKVAGMSGGFVGVDAFFVISGYLITALLAEEIERTGSVSLVAFFARRIRRLVPAAVLVLLATVLASVVVLPPLEVVRVATAAQSAAAYVSNVHFWRLASDYFSSDAASSAVVHTWSLSVEEQFYLIWPLILLSAAWRGRAFHRKRLGWILTAIGVASFAAAAFYTTANHSLAFYSMPLRAWEFATGGLASMIGWQSASERRGVVKTAPRIIAGWVGVGFLLSAAFSYSASTEFPGVGALLPVTGAAMVLVVGAQRSHVKWSVGAVLSTPPMQWIGQRSYGWYLWHWPMLVLGTAFVPSAGSLLRFALATGSLLLAALTYKYVEVPIRDAARATRAEPKREWRTVRLGFAAALIVIIAAAVTRLGASRASLGPTQRAFTTAASDVADPYRDGCVNDQSDDRVRVCVYGALGGDRTIALFGDSHAAQWFPALDAMARHHHWSLIVIAKTRCATAAVPVYMPETGAEFEACERWRAAAIDSLRQRRPAFVVLSNALVYVRGPRFVTELPAVSPNAWTAGMITTLKTFTASRIPSVVIQDTPLLAANVPICLARSGWLGHYTNSCATDRAIAIDLRVAAAEERAVAAVPGNHLVDLTDSLCGQAVCPPIVGGIVAYSDNEHITASMARSLAPTLEKALAELKLTALATSGATTSR